MNQPLNIRLVRGWSVHLFEQSGPVGRWKAVATKHGEVQQAIGVGNAGVLVALAKKCGINPSDMLLEFGLLSEH